MAILRACKTAEKSTNPNLTTQPNKKALPRKQPNDVQDALELLNRMVQMRPFPPIIQINKLLGTIAKTGDYTTALSHFKKLQLLGFEVDLYTMNIAINCYCRLNRKDCWMKLKSFLWKWNKMVAFQMVGLTIVIIRGFLARKKYSEAFELLEEMVAKGFSADEFTVSCANLMSTEGQDPALQEVIKRFLPKDRRGMEEIE